MNAAAQNKSLPAEMYDAATMRAENRAYDNVGQVVTAYAGWLRAQGWPKRVAGAFYAAALCYPGQPGMVSAAEAWASGGGSVRGPVRAQVHTDVEIAAVDRQLAIA